MEKTFEGDCANCVGLCCVALSRSRAGGFGADAAAGTPCHHLEVDNLCGIHATLRQEGWPACTVFDCFGAGQQVTQVTFGGDADWRRDSQSASEVFAAFGVMRPVMEMLRLLTEAEVLACGKLQARVREVLAELEDLAAGNAARLQELDVDAVRGRVGPLLGAVSEQHRAPVPKSRNFQPRAHLVGAKLNGTDISRHSLRSALLIAADLRGATCERTDLLGADLRDADLSYADLSGAIFLTQQQVSAARGNRGTRLPEGLRHPMHWM